MFFVSRQHNDKTGILKRAFMITLCAKYNNIKSEVHLKEFVQRSVLN